MNKLNKLLTVILLVVIVFAVSVYIAYQDQTVPLGGVNVGSECMSTTTGAGSSVNSVTVIDKSAGVLCNVIITGAGAGTFTLYDATTTNLLLRNRSQATSTIILASFGASAAVGTYPFEARYVNGLYSEFVGAVPTTTISTRK